MQDTGQLATYLSHHRSPEFEVTCPHEKANISIYFICKFLNLLFITCSPILIDLFIGFQFLFNKFLILWFLDILTIYSDG